MGKRVVELLAEGFEEIEALTPVDYLRRAGIEVVTAAVGEARDVRGARNIVVVADTMLAEWLKSERAEDWDAIILPGGLRGSENLAASRESGALVERMAAAGKWVCAICAAPAVALSPLGLLAGRKFTCYPGLEEKVRDGVWLRDRVVIDENPSGGGLITSRSAGCAGEFAVAIIGRLAGEDAGEKIAQSVLL
ncbi:MAG TPA: DJ-1 family protein [Treponema sp.]|nr:DJ-1 family protein [Treponema sp.]